MYLLNFVRTDKNTYYIVEYGYIKEGKVFRNAFLDFPEREIGLVKENEATTLDYFTERFSSLQAEIEDVESKIESQLNKGSFLMKVLNLKESLHEIDALGDFESVFKKLEKIEADLNEYITQNRHKNLQIKAALLEELKAVAKSHEWKSATAIVKEIQQKWIKTGAVEADLKDKIEGEFRELMDQFFERKAAFYAELEQMMKDKEADYTSFLEKAKAMISSVDPSKVRGLQKQLMTEWKELGKIKPEKHTEFWNQFQALLKAAANQSRGGQQNRKAGTEEALKRKRDMLDKLQKLSGELEPKVNLSQVRKEWKTTGFVPRELNQELNDAFYQITSLISEKIFLAQLVNKKAQKGISEEEKGKLRIKLLYDLLNRDLGELQTFEENVEKFNTSKGLDNLLEQKLLQQKRKVQVKRDLLEELKRG